MEGGEWEWECEEKEGRGGREEGKDDVREGKSSADVMEWDFAGRKRGTGDDAMALD
jgi:hypothetical protein